MHIQLSDHFTLPKLLRFVAPSIVMMFFTSIYSVVDGLYVSNFVEKVSFAAIDLISPLLMALGAVGTVDGPSPSPSRRCWRAFLWDMTPGCWP